MSVDATLAKIKRLKKLKEEARVNSTQVTKKLDISFADSIKQFGRSDRGETINVYNWHREYCNLISNLTITEVLTSGCAQNSKTLMHYFLLVYLLVEKQYNCLWVYSQERVMHRMVSIQFKPLMQYYLELSNRSNSGGGKSKSTTLYQFDKGNAIFSYSSTSKSVEGKPGAAAGSAMVSFSADIAFLEERSQWNPGSDAPVYRRLDASRIPSKPVRQLGTNGAVGTGIDEQMDEASHIFEPHCICDHCETEIHLHPFGTLLRPKTRTKPNGEVITSYLGSNGKPDIWFYHDENDAVETAYFGCPHCEGEIADETRIKKSYFRCVNTGISLEEFLEAERDPSKRMKVGINLLPLLKSSQYSLATYIINQGINSTNAADWQEQQLGIPSSSEIVKITLPMIKRVMASPMVDYEPPGEMSYQIGSHKLVTLCGIDCGRSSHWVTIITYYVPHDTYSESNNFVSDKSVRVVEFMGDVTVTDIPELLERYNVSYGIIDNEPDIASSARLCEVTCLEMADQKDKLFEEFKAGEARDGGLDYPIWKIRNDKFLRQTLTIFANDYSDGYPLIRLRDPHSWEKWLSIKSENSPIKHLTSVYYNPEDRKFIRPDDHCDDLYYSTSFCEAAFFIWLENGATKSIWD